MPEKKCEKLIVELKKSLATKDVVELANTMCKDLKWALSELSYVYNDLGFQVASFDDAEDENENYRDRLKRTLKEY